MSLSTAAADLASRIKGRIVDPSDAEYQNTIRIDNGRISHEPKLVVIPESPEDVAVAVKYAASEGIRLTARAGGHSATGYCLNSNGIVLDLKELNGISLDRQTGRLKIGMGNRWREVYDFMETSQTGRIPIGGGCPGVGVAGFLLGGGYSFVSRSYGLGSDNMSSLTLVTASGQIVTASPTRNQDLFWAFSGGGGGNFGVAVEAELQTQVPKNESMLMGQVWFSFYRIDEILPFYNDWVKTLPKEMAVYGYVGYQPDPRRGGQPVLSLRFTPVFNGSFGEGIELLQPLLKRRPISLSFYEMTIPEWEEFIGSGTLVKGRSAYIRSAVLPAGALTPSVAKVFMKHMARCPSPDTFIVWTHAGGKVSALAESATAFPHRRASFIPEVKAIWDSSRPELMRRNVEWAYDFFEELSGFGTGAYLNYIDPLLTDWQAKYYGNNYKRLLEIKNKWDPRGFFSFQQGVGSKFQPVSRKPLDLSPLSRT